MRSAWSILLLPSLVLAGSVSTSLNSKDLQAISRIPVRFEQDGAKTFAGKGFGYPVDLSPLGYRISLPGPEGPRTVAVSIAGASSGAVAQAIGQLSLKTAYFRGNHPDQWRTSVASFAKVRYEQVLPGIDVVYHGSNARFEFDFLVSPGADPRAIVLRYKGHDRLAVDTDGNLVVKIGTLEIVQQLPTVFQRDGESLRLVSGRYAIRGNSEVSFILGPYDHKQQLIIDPVVTYSSFVSGSGADTAVGVGRDSKGFLYVAGSTGSSDLSATANAFQSTRGTGQNIFLMKINPANPAGQDVIFLTYLGGSGTDELTAMTVDANGMVYLTGTTTSTNFPVTAAQQSVSTGIPDAFVVKADLTATDGSAALVYSTFFGGSGADAAYGIAADSAGNAYITGYTASTNLPLAGAPTQSSNAGGWDAFMAQFDPAGVLLYATYLGGSGTDIGRAIAVAKDGSVIVAGDTFSTDYPWQGTPYRTTYTSGGDVFVARIVPSQGAGGYNYGTYFGGSGLDEVKRIAINASGQVVLVGTTLSTDFPITLGALQPANAGGGDLFLSVLDLNVAPARSLVYSTYLGGNDADVPADLKLDSAGRAIVTGYTYSLNYPVTAGALQQNPSGLTDVFVSKVDPSKTGSQGLVYSTYAGGPLLDFGRGVEVDPAGNIYLVGSTSSHRFPTSSSVDRGSNPGDFDAFILGFQPCTYTLAPTGNTVGATGGDFTFLVTTGPDCTWTATSLVDWIIVGQGAAGVGNGSVSYNVGANASADPRTSAIAVGDQAFTVNQSAK